MPLYIEITALQCPACSKFFTTTRSRDSHLLQAKACKWYRRGKLPDIPFHNNAVADVTVSDVEMATQQLDEGPIGWQDDLDYMWGDSNWLDPSDDEEGNLDVSADKQVDRDEFLLLPPVPGPGPQTQQNRAQRSHTTRVLVLDDEDDTREIIEHPSAGAVFSRVKDVDGDITMEEPSSSSRCVESQFAPFKTELDWKFAQWAIKESIGHNSFNRLLDIPGVCVSSPCFINIC